ncbi:hypothetical protein POM88_049827 [Heracleum sosnowskyi]|uniref:RRM domain-containing protein n=1 Tax=Heracleum sosnowskyi TaxID=360622 RepID=A0AAD8GXL8_9APIA|nr:hypothetical protein POM88_049827 [Heracleum sosnowskyi]
MIPGRPLAGRQLCSSYYRHLRPKQKFKSYTVFTYPLLFNHTRIIRQSMANCKEGYLCMVTGLPKSATTEHVKANFSHFGKILDAMVFKDNFNDVSKGIAYIVFEEESARSALIKRSGTFFCGHMIGVCDDIYGFGRNAKEVHDSEFDAYISIGEMRKRGPGAGYSLGGRSKIGGRAQPDCGMIRPREGNTGAGSLEGSAKRLSLNDCP